MALVDVPCRVVYVELASRCHEPRIADARFLLERLVVVNDDLTLLILPVPDAHPDLVARLVVFRMNGPPLRGDLPAFRHLVGLLLFGDADTPLDRRISIERMVVPDPRALGMRLEEEASAAQQVDLAHHLPRVLFMLDRVGPIDDELPLAKVHRGADWTVLRVNPVRAASRMGNLAHLDDRFELLLLGVHDHKLVPLIRTPGAVPA